MRISSTAVIAGLALAVIVPSTVQASRLADNQALRSTPAVADGNPGPVDGDPVDPPLPAAAAEAAPEVSPALGSGADASIPDASGSDGSTSEPPNDDSGRLLPTPVAMWDFVVPPLVAFSEGGGFRVYRSTDLTVLRSGEAIVTSGRLGSRETWSFTLSRSKLEQLRSALEQAHFRTLRSLYLGRCPDCGVASITYAGRTVQFTRVVTWEPSMLGGIPKRVTPLLRLLSHLAYTPQTR